MGGLGRVRQVGQVGVRAALAIVRQVRQVGRVGVRAALAIVGQVRQVGQVGQGGQVG